MSCLLASGGYTLPALAEQFHLGMLHPTRAVVPSCELASNHLHRWAGVLVGQCMSNCLTSAVVQRLTSSVVSNESCHCFSLFAVHGVGKVIFKSSSFLTMYVYADHLKQ